MRWWSATTGIVEELLSSATTTSRGLQWEGPTIEGDESDWRVVTAPAGPGLYTGGAGIVLFLAAACRRGIAVDGDTSSAITATAWGLLGDARERLNVGEGTTGLVDSAASVAWGVAWIGHLLEEHDLAVAARELAVAAAAAVPLRGPVDLLGGSSGCILALLAVADDDKDVVEACHEEARRIVATATPEPLGCSWPHGEAEALLGLSHGTSGVALALAEVTAVTGDPSLPRVIDAALEYERSWYDATRIGWPDLRRSPLQPGSDLTWPALWCHGATGIGLARLRLNELAPAEHLVADAGAAVQASRLAVAQARAALRDGTPADSSLCHGLAGPAQLFLCAATLGHGEEHLRAARQTGDLILDQREASGAWPCGVRNAGQAPGLFLGTAGIGLTLMRLAEPGSAPAFALPAHVPSLAWP